MRLARSPTSGVWVTITKVWPFSRFSRTIRSMMSAVVLESSAPVGSSPQTMAGLLTSERAMVTRCRWPPDSSAGRLRALSPRPTCSSAASPRLRASPGLTPLTSSGSSTFSTALSTGSRL